jgi:hypothetical protein
MPTLSALALLFAPRRPPFLAFANPRIQPMEGRWRSLQSPLPFAHLPFQLTLSVKRTRAFPRIGTHVLHPLWQNNERDSSDIRSDKQHLRQLAVAATLPTASVRVATRSPFNESCQRTHAAASSSSQRTMAIVPRIKACVFSHGRAACVAGVGAPQPLTPCLVTAPARELNTGMPPSANRHHALFLLLPTHQ